MAEKLFSLAGSLQFTPIHQLVDGETQFEFNCV